MKVLRLICICVFFVFAGFIALGHTQGLPAAAVLKGQLNLDGALKTGTDATYIIKVKKQLTGVEYGPVSATSNTFGSPTANRFAYEIPMIFSPDQPLGATAGEKACVEIYHNATQLKTVNPPMVKAGCPDNSFEITIPEAGGLIGFNISPNTFAYPMTMTTPLPRLTMTYGAGTAVADGGTIPFGNVTIGAIRTITLTIQNTGDTGTTLNITGIGKGGAYTLSSTLDRHIAQGSSDTIDISFSPGSADTYTGTIAFNANTAAGGNVGVTINLTGTGQFEATAQLVRTGDDPAFGAQKVNTQSAEKTFTFTNGGTYNLIFGNTTLAGANATQFTKTADTCANQTILPAGTCNVKARFAPTSGTAEAKVATITVLSNTGKSGAGKDTPDQSHVINLTGTETDQNITVITPEPPGALAFGDVFVSSSKQMTALIRNDGNAPLGITSVSTTVPFSVSAFAGSVAAGQDASFNVTFSPLVAGDATGTLTINSDDPDASAKTINLTGKGETTALGLSLTTPPDPPILNFGTVLLNGDVGHTYFGFIAPAAQTGATCVDNLNKTVSCTFKVMNLLSGTSLQGLTASATGQFTVTAFAPVAPLELASFSLPGDASANISVRYTASGSTTAQTGTLTITSTNGGQRQVSLTGMTSTKPDTPANTTPADGSTNISLSPTLTASAFNDLDGDTYAGAQWTIKDASGNTIFVTQSLDASGSFTAVWAIGASDGVNGATPQYTVPKGLLEYGKTYGFQVSYKEARGATSAPSPLTSFTTMAQVAGENPFGVPNPVNNSGTLLTALNTTNVATLPNDAAFKAAVPQTATLTTIVNAGTVAVDASNNVTLNVGAAGGFLPVKSNGGTGQAVAMAAETGGTITNIQPISPSAGQSVDASGTAVTLTYGLFDITVNVGAGATTRIVIVPPTPFPAGTKWYKINPVTNTLVLYNNFAVTAAGNGILTLTDNLAGDSDPASGVIRDPGGVAVPPAAAAATIDDSSSGGGGCFIATAAFGSYLDPYVMVLRNFRDMVLMTSETGRAFVDWYYRISPPIADFIATNGTLKASARIALLPAVGFAALSLKIGTFWTMLLMLLVLGGTMMVLRKAYRLSREA